MHERDELQQLSELVEEEEDPASRWRAPRLADGSLVYPEQPLLPAARRQSGRTHRPPPKKAQLVLSHALLKCRTVIQ